MCLSTEEKHALVTRYHAGGTVAEIYADTGIARSMFSKQGKSIGTFSQPMTACEFASWITLEFKMLLLKLRSIKYTGNIRMSTPGNQPSPPTPVPEKADAPSVTSESCPVGIPQNLWMD